jgi:hypothetical protein
MAPRRGRVLAAPIVFPPRDESAHRFATGSRASSVASHQPRSWAPVPDQRERSQSAPMLQRHKSELSKHKNQSEPTSRGSSLGSAVGFLLSRARQQKMTSLSSKRSRSSSSIYSRQRSLSERQNRHHQQDVSNVTNLSYHTESFHHRPGVRYDRNEQQHQSYGHQAKQAARDVESRGPPPLKSSRHEKELQFKDGSSMFTGLASIPLDPVRENKNATTRHAGGEYDDEDRSSVRQPPRVQPIWVLIGTFKTTMDNIVRISGASLQWHQRNPKGGFQSMQIAISLITEVSCARVAVSRDEAPTFSVIMKTAGKPSQVTFGFARVNDATSFKSMLVQVIRSISI